MRITHGAIKSQYFSSKMQNNLCCHINFHNREKMCLVHRNIMACAFSCADGRGIRNFYYKQCQPRQHLALFNSQILGSGRGTCSLESVKVEDDSTKVVFFKVMENDVYFLK